MPFLSSVEDSVGLLAYLGLYLGTNKGRIPPQFAVHVHMLHCQSLVFSTALPSFT